MESYLPFLIVVLILVGTGLVIFLAFRNMRQQAFQAQNRRAEIETQARQAIWAGANILTARHHTSAEEMRESVRVDLTLQVQPPQGDSYIARTSWRVSLPLLSQFQPGQSISVKIDQKDPKVIYPNQPGAEYWG